MTQYLLMIAYYGYVLLSKQANIPARCRHDMRPSAWLYVNAHCTAQS